MAAPVPVWHGVSNGKFYTELPPDACKRCDRPPVRRRGRLLWLCEKHARFMQMRTTAKSDKKAVPSIDELEQMLEAIGGRDKPVCPTCSRDMVWIAERGAMSCLLTLQHDRSGLMRFLCHRCNTKHAMDLEDDFYGLPAGHKRCNTCRLVKPVELFWKSPRATTGRRAKCRPCELVSLRRYQAFNRERINAQRRARRVKAV